MNTQLLHYIIAVTIIWAIILLITWFMGDGAHFRTFAYVCGGFVIGMTAMFIATQVYR